jgi:hypothetical protein
MILDDGTKCRARIGGAWPGRSDATYATYGCGFGSEFLAVWAQDGMPSGGIDRTPSGWTVQLGSDTGPLTTHTVETAYFVGMA